MIESVSRLRFDTCPCETTFPTKVPACITTVLTLAESSAISSSVSELEPVLALRCGLFPMRQSFFIRPELMSDIGLEERPVERRRALQLLVDLRLTRLDLPSNLAPLTMASHCA